MISDYHRDNKIHTDLISEIMMSQIELTIQCGLSVLIEGLSLELFEKVKNEYEVQYEVLPIRVTANKEVLEKRFLERIESVKNSGSKISNLSIDVFWQLYEKFNVDLGYGETIDTSNMKKEKLVSIVKKHLF